MWPYTAVIVALFLVFVIFKTNFQLWIEIFFLSSPPIATEPKGGKTLHCALKIVLFYRWERCSIKFLLYAHRISDYFAFYTDEWL